MKKVKKYKISRRLGAPLFEKCATQKFVLREQRKAVTKKRKKKFSSDYGKQLFEKQKVRYLYSISEKVLKNYVKDSIKTKNIDADQALAQKLESRLDNVVFQLGIAPTRRMGRQMVSHGHFIVNGKKTKVPSYQINSKDIVSIREGSKNTKLFQELLLGGVIKPRVDWVSWDKKKQVGSVIDIPKIDGNIFSLPVILEYYSR